MSASLVGSEMCIRDRDRAERELEVETDSEKPKRPSSQTMIWDGELQMTCLLYTSDAADDM
eukprot:5084029-Alexandrium_andersonii.AAC.1